MNAKTQKILGRNLKMLRHYYQISQDKLADIANISRSQYAQYELGNRTPDIEVLHNICRHFGQSVDIMLEGDLDQFLYSVSSSDYIVKNCDRLVHNYCKLTLFSKGRLLEFSDRLLEEDGVRAQNAAKLNKKKYGE